MSLVSILIIVLCVLGLGKWLIPFKNITATQNFNLVSFLKSHLSEILFFLITAVLTTLITQQPLGLNMLLAVAWWLFYRVIKKESSQVVAWWTLILFFAYCFADFVTYQDQDLSQVWLISLFSWTFGFFILLLIDVLQPIHKWLAMCAGLLISIILFYVPLLFNFYFISFEIPMGIGQINAVLQSNLSESKEFVSHHLHLLGGGIILLHLLIPVILIYLAAVKSNSTLSKKFFFKLLIVVLIGVNLNVMYKMPIIYSISNAVEVYQKEFQEFRAELQKRKTGDIQFEASKLEEKELHIVVIGESLNKNHMGLYGYYRNTTPLLKNKLDSQEIIKFDYAYSNHVHTVPVLVQALTEANQLNKKEYTKSLSILDIQDAAGFETYWLTNQISYGGWDNPVSVLAERADHRFNFNSNIGLSSETTNYDYALVEKLREITQKPLKKNTVIYLHLMGNHGNYDQRHPKEFTRFKGPLKKEVYGDNSYWPDNINWYDNSVVYNDFIVNEIMETAKNHNGVATCLYFSDHSEEVILHKGHDAGNFRYSMVQIPLLLWTSEAYQNKYPLKMENLKKNTQTVFTNDFVYDFLIGLENIHTRKYSASHDLSDSSYYLPKSQTFTIHGEKKIMEKDNFYYFNQAHTDSINAMHQSSRIINHRVNTLGKLSQILNYGASSFELDLIIKGTGDSVYFAVGHDEGALSKLTFKEILEFCQDYKIEKIWMDVKNLNQVNLPSILKHLERLNTQFSIKDKVLFESDLTHPSVEKLHAMGWYTSYYVPSHLKDAPESELIALGAKLNKQIRIQKLSAISFDHSLYPIIKKYVAPFISNQVDFHTWNVKLGFYQPELLQTLRGLDYFQDPRVKTILIKSKSEFEL